MNINKYHNNNFVVSATARWARPIRDFRRFRMKFRSFGLHYGFTFIELIMVIVIFSIFSGVVMFNFGNFSDSISVQNLAQQIALEIKQAQSDSISGKDAGSFSSTGCSDSLGNSAPCRPSYGVSFNLSSNTKFIYFQDVYNDGLTNDDLSNSEVFNIERGNFINDICFDENCGKSSVSITFIRPFPNAHFYPVDEIQNNVKIVVKSPRSEAKRTITVTSLGQISVQ